MVVTFTSVADSISGSKSYLACFTSAKSGRRLFVVLTLVTLCVIIVTCLTNRCHLRWYGCDVIPRVPSECRGHLDAPMTRVLPQGLILGVRKAGTGAVAFYLRNHPRIVIPSSEVSFFDSNYDKGYEWYRQQFPPVAPHTFVMEKTSNYFHNARTIPRVYEMNKEMKLIVVVRDPIARTVSDFVQRNITTKGIQFSETDINDFLVDYLGDLKTQSIIVKPSLYYRHAKKWLETFRRDQIMFVNGENLIKSPYEEVFKLETFLGVPHCMPRERFELNKTKGFFCLKKPQKTKCLPPSKGRKHPDLKPDVRQKLENFFGPYNNMFFKLINKTFDWHYNV